MAEHLCVCCSAELDPPLVPVAVHPNILAPVCLACESNEDLAINTGDEGCDDVCVCCGEGVGTLLLCDECPVAWCERCVETYSGGGSTGLAAALAADPWSCLICDPKKPLAPLEATLQALQAKNFESIPSVGAVGNLSTAGTPNDHTTGDEACTCRQCTIQTKLVEYLESVEDAIAAANDALEEDNAESVRLQIHTEICGPHVLPLSAEEAEVAETEDSDCEVLTPAGPDMWQRSAAVEWQLWRKGWEERLELLFLHQAQLQSQLEDHGVNLSAFYNQLANYDQAQLATSTLAVQKLEAMAKSAADAEIDASGSQRRAEVAAAYEAEQKGKLGPEEYERRYYAETVGEYAAEGGALIEVEELQEEQGARGSDGRQVTARELKRAQASEASVAATLVPEVKDADEERRSAASRGERKNETPSNARRRRVPTPGEQSRPSSKKSSTTSSTPSSASRFAPPEVAGPPLHEHYMCIARGGVAFRRSLASSNNGSASSEHTGLNVNEAVMAKVVSHSPGSECTGEDGNAPPVSTCNWLEVKVVPTASDALNNEANHAPRFLPLRNDVGEPLFVELQRAHAIVEAAKAFVTARRDELEADSMSEVGPCTLTGGALTKIQKNPSNPLFRNLLLHKSKFQNIWQCPPARALLEAVGFREHLASQGAPVSSPQAPSPKVLPTSEVAVHAVAPLAQPTAPTVKPKAMLAVGPLEDGAVVYALRVIDDFNGDPPLPKVSRSAEGNLDAAAAAPSIDKSTKHPSLTRRGGSSSDLSQSKVSNGSSSTNGVSTGVLPTAQETISRTKGDVCKLLDNGSWFDASLVARGGAFNEVWKFWVGGEDDDVEGPAWLTTVHKSELESRVKWGEGKGAKSDHGHQRSEKRKLKKALKAKKQVRVGDVPTESAAASEATSTEAEALPASTNMPLAVPSIRSEGATVRKRPRASMGSVKLGSHSSTEDSSSSSSSDEDMPRVGKLTSPPRKRKNNMAKTLTTVFPANALKEKEPAKSAVNDSVDLVSSDDNDDAYDPCDTQGNATIDLVDTASSNEDDYFAPSFKKKSLPGREKVRQPFLKSKVLTKKAFEADVEEEEDGCTCWECGVYDKDVEAQLSCDGYEALRGKKHNCEATYHRACLPPSRRPGLSRAEEAEWRCDRCEVKHTAYRAKEEALEEEREAAASQGAIEQESFEDPESEVTRAALAKARAPVPKMVFGRREKYREAKAREDERLLLIGGAAKRPRAKKPKNSTPQVDDEDALEAADEAAMALDDTLLNVYEVTRAAQQPRTRQRASLGTPQGGGEDSGAPSSKDLEVRLDGHFSGKLKAHQLAGVRFMFQHVVVSVDSLKKGCPGFGCVLAHSMGLGKTLQVVALVHTLLTNRVIKAALEAGPTFTTSADTSQGEGSSSAPVGQKQRLDRILIITPVTTVSNWVNEFKMWKPSNMPAQQYEQRIFHDFSAIDNRLQQLDRWYNNGGVCIVGYEFFKRLVLDTKNGSASQKNGTMGSSSSSSTSSSSSSFSSSSSSSDSSPGVPRGRMTGLTATEILTTHGPDLCVCDEGHLLKKLDGKANRAVSLIRTRRKVLLTGTPIQNNLSELYVVYQVVRPHLLGTPKEFQSRFVDVIEAGMSRDASDMQIKRQKTKMALLHNMLSPYTHRRKASLLSRHLPPKHETVIYVRFSPHQAQLYQTVTREKVEAARKSNRSINIITAYRSLQAVWTHPWVAKTNWQRAVSKAAKDAKKKKAWDVVPSTMVNRSILSNLNPVTMVARPAPSMIPAVNTAEYMAGTAAASATLRAAANGHGNTSANGHDGKGASDLTTRPLTSLISVPSRSPSPTSLYSESGGEGGNESDNDDDDADGDVGDGTSTEAPLLSLADAIKSPDSATLFGADSELSGKSAVCLALVAEARRNKDKVIVFSTSCTFLDLLEKLFRAELRLEPRHYARLDGTLSKDRKDEEMSRFKHQPGCSVFLLSLKAANVGINLTSATRVILADQSWNPADDLQAIFRSYRYGQHKPVFVYRLVSSGSLEHKIFNRQLNKRALALGVADDDHQARQFDASETADLLIHGELAVLEADGTAATATTTATATTATATTTATSTAATATANAVTTAPSTVIATGAASLLEGIAVKTPALPVEENGLAAATGSTMVRETAGTSSHNPHPTINTTAAAVAAAHVDDGPSHDVVLRALREGRASKWVHFVKKFDSLEQPDTHEELTEEELAEAERAYQAEVNAEDTALAAMAAHGALAVPMASSMAPSVMATVAAAASGQATGTHGAILNSSNQPIHRRALHVPTVSTFRSPFATAPP